MNDNLPSAHRPALIRVVSDPLVSIGMAIGFAPVLAGLIFTTYGFVVSPGWAEALRQLDAPFILIEIAAVLWARKSGMSYRAIFDRLDVPVRLALILFLTTFWVSSAFISPYPTYSLTRSIYWVIHIAFGFAVFHLCGTVTVAGLRRGGAALMVGFLVFLPLMFVHLLTAPDPASLPEGKIIWTSAIPGCLSVRHLGIWATLVLSCAIGALYNVKPKSSELVIVCFVVFAATATLFWSGTRAGVYGGAAGFIMLLATLRSLPSYRSLLAAGAAVFVGVLISEEVWLPVDGSFGFISRFAGVQPSGGDLQAMSSGRTVLWESMMQAFAGSPLFGVGEGAVHWLAVIGESERNVQPHNSVIQALSSWGIIASLAASYLVAKLLLTVHRMARRDARVIPLVLMIDSLLFMSLADGVLYFSRFIMWFAGGSAVVLAAAVRGVDPATSAPRLEGDELL